MLTTAEYSIDALIVCSVCCTAYLDGSLRCSRSMHFNLKPPNINELFMTSVCEVICV